MKVISALGPLSGSIGGMTAAHNRGGYYFRQRVTPTDPSTARQNNIRGIFTSLVNAWFNTLTATERANWDMYAANTPQTDVMGQVLMLTGQQTYIRNNSPRIQASLARIDTAPTIYNNGEAIAQLNSTTAGTPNTFEVDTTAGDIEGVFQLGAPASDDGDLLLYWGPSVNSSRNFWKGPYQWAAIDDVTSGSAVVIFTVVYTGALWHAANLPVAATHVPIQARVTYDDGRLSPIWRVIAGPIEDVTP